MSAKIGANDRVQSVRFHFVDEAGDGTLFDKRGRVIVGAKGCSRFFILGLLDILDPAALAADMESLRERLLADPYFKDVPSMKQNGRKTALAFHAKDDLPEVRREVFSLLCQHEMSFFAVIRDKKKVLEYVSQRGRMDSGYHYHPNELYDYMVRRLFRDHLHKDDRYEVYFAIRGNSKRTAALAVALQAARQRFRERFGITSGAPIEVKPSDPRKVHGLQAVDYFLWALQRLYERSESRYVELMWPAFKVVNDIDDCREARYGVYYTQSKPLTSAAINDRQGI